MDSQPLKPADLLAGLGLALIAILLYRASLTLWWTWDDFFNLHHVITHRASDYLLTPSIWRSMPNRLFTPLQMLSYEADLAVFGLQPKLFYVHQLVTLILSAMLFHVFLRLWVDTIPAFLGALLLIAGVPIATIAQQLMVRHYVEGFLFALVAIGLFVLALRHRNMLLSVLAALLYLFAAGYKEVFVPLPFLMLIVPEGNPRIRFRFLFPHFLAFVFYLSWRFVMLGTLVGGYGWAIKPHEWLSLGPELPVKALTAFSPDHWLGWFITAFVIATVGFLFSVEPRRIALILAVLVLMFAPLLPASKVFENRFAFVPWAASCFAVAIAFGRFQNRVVGLVIGALVVIVLVGNRMEWTTLFSEADRMSREGRFFLRLQGGSLLWEPSIPPAAIGELRWFKEQYLRRPKGAGWFYDRLYACLHPADIHKVWSFDVVTREFRDVTKRFTPSEACSAIKWDQPLTISLEKRGTNLFWELGPYVAGEYAFLIEDGKQVYKIPRKDGFQIGNESFKLRVRYRSPDGWLTYSRELAVPAPGLGLRWRRG